MTEIPLFPLNTVLFPGAPLNLHIFEERYKLMIGRCIEANAPFGVVLLRSGSEVQGMGTAAQPYAVGCTARITQVEALGGGRMNIVTVGQERFRIRLLVPGQPYLVGKTEPFALTVEHPERVRYLARRLRSLVVRYVGMIAETDAAHYDFRQLPRDSISLTYLASSLLNMPPEQKQELLETASALDLVEQVYALYRREVALVQTMLLPPQPATDSPFSLN